MIDMGRSSRLEFYKDLYDSGILTDKTFTVSGSSCKHANGWYHKIPKRFFGQRWVFVCSDCGDMLEWSPYDKP